MPASPTVARILEQDPRLTRAADERSFFQLLRGVLEREPRRSAAPGPPSPLTARDAARNMRPNGL